MQEKVPDGLPGLRGAHERVRHRAPRYAPCTAQQPKAISGRWWSPFCKHAVDHRDGHAARPHVRRRQLAGRVQHPRPQARSQNSIQRCSHVVRSARSGGKNIRAAKERPHRRRRASDLDGLLRAQQAARDRFDVHAGVPGTQGGVSREHNERRVQQRARVTPVAPEPGGVAASGGGVEQLRSQTSVLTALNYISLCEVQVFAWS